MERLRNDRTNPSQWQRWLSSLLLADKPAATNQGRTQGSGAMTRRWFAIAAAVAALALLPLSHYGVAGAQNSSQSSGAIQASDAANAIRFTLVPAADAIASCFPNAKVKGTLIADEEGTDTLTLSGKGLPPNTTFAVFLTELPVGPFGAVEYIADLVTNSGGKGAVEINAIVKDAFVSQVIDGQRVRKELNHLVLWFGDPADANACFAPGNPPITPFDADGVAGPAAISSKNSLPGAPLP